MVLAIAILLGGLVLRLEGTSENLFGTALAAEGLKIDGLPNDPRQFRTHVDQLLGKVDTLIRKLKADPKAQGMVLDLIQTRDDILREITKIESAPGDAKWTPKEMRESVEGKLKLLKDQYDKAVAMAT